MEGYKFLYSEDEVAEILGVQLSTLTIWRTAGKGPRYTRFSYRSGEPFYTPASIQAFIDDNTFQSTSEESARRQEASCR